MFKRLVQLFLLFFLAAAGVLAWFAWYVSTPLLIPVGGFVSAPEPRAGYSEIARENAAFGGKTGAGCDSRLLE